MIVRFSLEVMVFVGGSFLRPASASAELITLNLAEYAQGTEVSDVSQGLSLRTFVNKPGDRFNNPIYAPARISTYFNLGSGIGTGDFREYLGCVAGAQSGFECTLGYTVLELQFETPTNFLEITSSFLADFPMMQVFDAAGHLLTQCGAQSNFVADCSLSYVDAHAITAALSYSSESDLISRVLIGGDLGSASIQRISYGVPEPTTFALTTLGIAAARFSVRRRRPR